MSSTTHSPEEPIGVGSPRQPRTLVLCFDGTSNKFCIRNTNIIKLYSILKKDSPKTQLCGNRNVFPTWCEVPFAYKLYKSRGQSAKTLAMRFKKAFSREIPIEFLGVWDTVASVGILNRRTLPFVGTNNTITVFRQALSLDECRAKFCSNLYHRPVTDPGMMWSSQTEPLVKRMACSLGIGIRPKQNPDTTHSPLDTYRYRRKQGSKDVKEVWTHCDIGGGLAWDKDKNSLSNISLHWRVREIVRTECNIQFGKTALGLLNIPIATIEQVPLGREASDSTLLGDQSELALSQGAQDKQDASATREVNVSPSASASGGKEAPPTLPSPEVEEPLDEMDAIQKMGNAFKKSIF